MSSDQSALAPQTGRTACKAITLDATAADSTQILFPDWVRRFTVRLKTSADADEAGHLAFEGTDGAAIDADHFPIESGEVLSFTVVEHGQSSEGTSIFLTADGASSVAHIVFEGEGRGA